jgi:hypothetical protein
MPTSTYLGISARSSETPSQIHALHMRKKTIPSITAWPIQRQHQKQSLQGQIRPTQTSHEDPCVHHRKYTYLDVFDNQVVYDHGISCSTDTKSALGEVET